MSEPKKQTFHLTMRVFDAAGSTLAIGFRCFKHRPTDNEVETWRAALLAEHSSARNIVIARIP